MVEQRIEVRVARETAEATAHLKDELQRVQQDLETQEEIGKSQAAQLKARRAENKALQDEVGALGDILQHSENDVQTWKKRKQDMDERIDELLKEIADSKQKGAEAAREAFDKGYAEGEKSVMSMSLL